MLIKIKKKMPRNICLSIYLVLWVLSYLSIFLVLSIFFYHSQLHFLTCICTSPFHAEICCLIVNVLDISRYSISTSVEFSNFSPAIEQRGPATVNVVHLISTLRHKHTESMISLLEELASLIIYILAECLYKSHLRCYPLSLSQV